MVRRRTATLSVTAAALLFATPLLTSCGAAHAGAAAVVGGQTISMADLQAQVRQVRTAQNRTAQATQLIEATSDLDRQELSTLVRYRVLDRAARDNGIKVTVADVQKVRASFVQQTGGTAQLASAMLQQGAIAPSQADAFFRFQAQLTALDQRLGTGLSPQQAQAAVLPALIKAAKELRVDINPRYGSWDAKTVALTDAKQPWIHQVTPAGQPTPAAGQGAADGTAQDGSQG